MTQETVNYVLEAEKPVSVWLRPLNINLKKLLFGLAKLGLGTQGDSQLAADGSTDVSSSLGFKDNPAILAWQLIFDGLLAAMSELVRDNRHLWRRALRDEQIAAKIAKQLEDVSEKLAQDMQRLSVRIDRDFLEHPDRLPLLARFQPYFRDWLLGFDINLAEANAISLRLPRQFGVKLHALWMARARDYEPLKQALEKTSPVAGFARRDQAWRRNGERLKAQADERVFDEAFSLEQVYIELRAWYSHKPEGAEKPVQQVTDVSETLLAWVRAAEKSNPYRVVSGGPGSGKSSFAKILAARVSAAMPEDERENYTDPQQLLTTDQREQWWQRYHAARGEEPQAGMPAELHGKHLPKASRHRLTDISAQPLLNYLVALAMRGGLQIDPTTSLNRIYAKLLEGVYRREYEDVHRSLKGIRDDVFYWLLEEIAVTAWHGGDARTTTVAAIQQRCGTVLEDHLAHFKHSAQEGVTSLLTSFYFRKLDAERSEESFEFTHKSFGEYLIARAMVNKLDYIHSQLLEHQRNPRHRFDILEALAEWAALCGPTAVDEDLMAFILDEIALPEYETKVEAWQGCLTDLLRHAIAHGMPMEKLNPRPPYQEEMYQARNAEEALLVALHGCLRVLNREEIRCRPRLMPEETIREYRFRNWLLRLDGQAKAGRSVLFYRVLAWLNIASSSLYLIDFTETNLREVDLSGAHLSGARLSGADLSRADLSRADLSRADLSRADLSRADLSRADLSGADLSRADLSRADLSGADLSGADLSGADLRHTIHLNQAIGLESANLTDAKLPEGFELPKRSEEE